MNHMHKLIISAIAAISLSAFAQTNYRNPQTIRQVQQALIDHGHDVGRVDGVWGTRTQQALRSFQSDQGITSSSNNMLDTQTMAALGVTPSTNSPSGIPNDMQRSPATNMPSDTSTRSGRSGDMMDDGKTNDSLPKDSGINPGQR